MANKDVKIVARHKGRNLTFYVRIAERRIFNSGDYNEATSALSEMEIDRYIRSAEMKLEKAKTHIGIQVVDPESVKKEIWERGIHATVSMDDEIEVHLKYRKPMVAWMLRNGWDQITIQEVYPALVRR